MMLWQETAPGVWKTAVGLTEQHQGLTPLQCIGALPQLTAMEKLPHAELPLELATIALHEAGGRRILSVPLQQAEKLYGMGLQFMRMNQRGRTRYLRVNSDPKQDTGETHAPVPFYISDSGYGLLIDTSRIVTIHAGSTHRQEDTAAQAVRDRNTDSAWQATLTASKIEIVLPADGADVYIFAGPQPADVVRRYNLFCGGGVLPPKWGLGFWHRVPKMFHAAEALDEALAFRHRDFPCDCIGLEPGWHSKSYPVTNEWSEERFPDPAQFVSAMRAEGFRVNLWEHPYVSPDSRIYPALKALSGSHTVWGGIAPDYSLPEARALYMKQHQQDHVEIGVAGYKLDECDGSELTNHSWMFPAHASFPSGLDGEQMRQLYGLMFQKMTADLYRNSGLRTFGLVRASNAAASSMPYVLYSDLYDHKQFIRGISNASFCGLLWTPEVRKAQNAEDWVRRMQSVCFSPMAMLNAWGDGTKPWSYPEVEPIVRHYIKLRMRLLPYLYTAFAQYREEGTPPFRAMPLVMTAAEIAQAEAHSRQAQAVGETLNTTDAAYGKRTIREWDDQFMIGDSLLAAPMVAGEAEREVLLPGGIWYGFETGERYTGGQVIRVKPGLERIPLFVREGAIIPLMADRPHMPKRGERVQLELIHFGMVPGTARFYDDDGETFAYENGEAVWCKLAVTQQADGAWSGEITDAAPHTRLFMYDDIRWRCAQVHI